MNWQHNTCTHQRNIFMTMMWNDTVDGACPASYPSDLLIVVFLCWRRRPWLGLRFGPLSFWALWSGFAASVAAAASAARPATGSAARPWPASRPTAGTGRTAAVNTIHTIYTHRFILLHVHTIYTFLFYAKWYLREIFRKTFSKIIYWRKFQNDIPVGLYFICCKMTECKRLFLQKTGTVSLNSKDKLDMCLWNTVAPYGN